MRERIESVFGVKVYDFYGAREAQAIAGECSHGLLHVFTFNNHVELLNLKSGGDEGEVIITLLHSFSMPFIRYRIGDVAASGPSRCSCGCPLPTLKRITGRIVDYFVREDGGLVYGLYFIRLLRVNRWVKSFQVIQEDYKRVRIIVAVERVDKSWIKYVEDQIRLTMGLDCKVIWEFVNEIPKTVSGKHLYVKSLLYRE